MIIFSRQKYARKEVVGGNIFYFKYEKESKDQHLSGGDVKRRNNPSIYTTSRTQVRSVFGREN